MKNLSIITFFTLLLAFICDVQAQEQKVEFDPAKLKAEYFAEKEIKDKLEFSDKKGNQYRIRNSDYSKGLYIKKDDKWLKHGIWFSHSSGRLTSQTTWSFGKREGAYISYHSNGEKNFEYEYKNDVKDGNWFQYNDKGKLVEQKVYKNGILEGPKISYHSNGEKSFTSTYVNGELHGEKLQYNDRGKLVARTKYNMGEKVGKTESFY